MADAQNPNAEVTTDAPSSEPEKFVLRLKGPKPKVGQLPQVTAVAFPVRGHLIEVPINGEPMEVTEAQYNAITEQELPAGYSWLDAEGAEIIFGTEEQTEGDVPAGEGEQVGGFVAVDAPQTSLKGASSVRANKATAPVSGSGSTTGPVGMPSHSGASTSANTSSSVPAGDVSVGGAIGGQSTPSTSVASTTGATTTNDNG